MKTINKTIRGRLITTFLIVVIGGTGLQLALAGLQLRQATLTAYRTNLESNALLIASTLTEPLEHATPGRGSASIVQRLTALQQDGQYEFLVVDTERRALGYTPAIGYTNLIPVSRTPELEAVSTSQLGADIRPSTTGESTLYVAAPVIYEGDAIGYLVIAEPLAPAYAIIRRQWLQLIATSVPVVVLVIGAGLWLSGSISRPVTQVRDSALRMAGGAFETRIDHTSEDEIGQMAVAFNHMASQIEALIKTQRRFVSNAAHELRTPLMTLKLRAEALQSDAVPEAERKRYAAEIAAEIDHMAALVTSLLTLARIDEGQTQAAPPPDDTSAAFSDIARHWRIAASRAGLDFERDIPMDLPTVSISANSLRLVLDNLLGNAVKYTERGSVRMAVENIGEAVLVRIQDTGVGFTEEQAEHLFTRFYRTSEVRTQFDGSGLGLSIVDAILERYGGEISATSSGPGRGATFTVRVPVAQGV
ncbi:MAG: HAMP domain-containing sensor histidine kinase [Chloroflexota bacterium]